MTLMAQVPKQITSSQEYAGQLDRIGNDLCEIALSNANDILWTFHLKQGQDTLRIHAPVFEVDGKNITAMVSTFNKKPTLQLRNGVIQYTFEGPILADPTIQLSILFRVAPDNPIIRFQYSLHTTGNHNLTKSEGKDNFTYCATSLKSFTNIKEIRLSEFNDKYHAYTLEEASVNNRHFEDDFSAMGPMIVFSDAEEQFLLAYEHGSQLPNRFLEFQFHPLRDVSLQAVKSNYLNNQPLNDEHSYETLWFEIGGAKGNQSALQKYYRDFMLHYITENMESRKPYIFYNSWGRQERDKNVSGSYLSSMNLATTLKEIDIAHQMGVDIFEIDAGWFSKTGDWQVNTSFFPDSLKQVKAKLDGYGMKLGLWFNPTVAAVDSKLLADNLSSVMSWKGEKSKPRLIWETKESVNLCLVSSYWESYADNLMDIIKKLGVTYIYWDGVGSYGCDDPNHFHGTSGNSEEERAESYAFQLPIYMSKVIDKVCKAYPNTIFDFDVTERDRCVGLQFLSSGKFFFINNGPYYANYDLAPEGKSPLKNGNTNIFVNPGPARGWFARSVLNYDQWIPSILLFAPYMSDEPKNSQTINIASLILGANGLWGELMKVSPEGIAYFNEVLGIYKQVKNDITESSLVKQGETGSSPEIYEKINEQTGKGVIVAFANVPGTYTYISQNKVAKDSWKNEGVQVSFDAKGRAVLQMTFDKSGAKMVFFGAKE
ncbi:alpha-galactosidase [Ilyomonas limi]|nr:alpha-galactosidase [Ilyomonas limi]